MPSNLDYEHDICIDPHALDVEWINQPNTFMKYATECTEARKRMDEAKERLDIKKAEVDLDIRANPDKHNIPKVTEASIAATLKTNREVIQREQEFINTKSEYELLNVAVRALDTKKTALENLVKLQAMEYFAGPKEPRELGNSFSKTAQRNQSIRDTAETLGNSEARAERIQRRRQSE